jgi:hypothetical protein
MIGAEWAPLELAGRLALAFGLVVFLGLAFEEVYKREDRSNPGGVRTFPMLAVSGAMLYLIEPQHALAFIDGTIRIGPMAPRLSKKRAAQPQCNQPDDTRLKFAPLPHWASRRYATALGGCCCFGDCRYPSRHSRTALQTYSGGPAG